MNELSDKKVVSFKPKTEAKPKRRRKIRYYLSMGIFGVTLGTLIIGAIYYSSSMSRLDMIYYDGLDYVSRADIVTLANLREQPAMSSLNETDIKNQLLSHPLVETVKVSKESGNDLNISIVEKKVLGCIVKGDEYEYVLSDGTLIDLDEFSNQVCQGIIIDTKSADTESIALQLFIEELLNVDEGIVQLIQEINYEPLFGDYNRFSLYLKDGNQIKVNSYTMVEKLKYYTTMKQKVKELQGEVSGVYHLDVGDYFKPYDTK